MHVIQSVVLPCVRPPPSRRKEAADQETTVEEDFDERECNRGNFYWFWEPSLLLLISNKPCNENIFREKSSFSLSVVYAGHGTALSHWFRKLRLDSSLRLFYFCTLYAEHCIWMSGTNWQNTTSNDTEDTNMKYGRSVWELHINDTKLSSWKCPYDPVSNTLSFLCTFINMIPRS